MSKFNYKKYKHHDWHAQAQQEQTEKQVAPHIAAVQESARQDAIVEELKATITVFGVGGGGSNAVNSMVNSDLEGVSFMIANTDAQALRLSEVPTKIQMGTKITKGLGAGSNPEIGRRAAEEDLEAMMEHLANTDILFITAGLGGGTGTGAMPVIAKAAREQGILTVGVVTKPFLFEGKRRERQAEEAAKSLRDCVDTLIVIPNQKLLELADPKISVLDAFALANDVLKQAIKGVADIIIRPGHMNVDFADVHSIMRGMGMAIMGTGRCSGEDRARKAALNAINSSLVEDVCIEGAKGVLINITGSSSLGLHEISEAANIIYEKASEDANIILGSVIDDAMGEEVMVTVIATGLSHERAQATLQAHQAAAPRAHAAPQQVQAKPVEWHAMTDLPQVDRVTAFVAPQQAAEKKVANPAEMIDVDDLETPTFIRERAQREKEKQRI